MKRFFLPSLLLTIALFGGFLGLRFVRTNDETDWLGKGELALSYGDELRAEDFARRLDVAGHTQAAHLLRGEAYSARGDDASALRELVQVKDSDTWGVRAAVISGQCLLRLKRLQEAEQAWRFVLSKEPDNVLAHRGLAVVYYDQGALQAALDHLEAVCRLAPRDGRPWRMKGLILKDLAATEQAIECYREALQRELEAGAMEESRLELAECLLKQSRYEEVLDALRALDASHSPQAIALAAEADWGLGRAEDSIRALDDAIQRHPRAPELLRARAKIHRASDEPEKAAPLLQEVLSQDRHDYASRFQLAQTLERLGRGKEALEQRRLGEETQALLQQLSDLSQQAMRSPWDASLQRQLAAVCDKLDKPALAAMWLQAAASAEGQPPLKTQPPATERRP